MRRWLLLAMGVLALAVTLIVLLRDDTDAPRPKPTPAPVLAPDAARLEIVVIAQDGTGRRVAPRARTYIVMPARGVRQVARASARGRLVLYGVPAGTLRLRSAAGGRAQVRVPAAGGVLRVPLCVRACAPR